MSGKVFYSLSEDQNQILATSAKDDCEMRQGGAKKMPVVQYSKSVAVIELQPNKRMLNPSIIAMLLASSNVATAPKGTIAPSSDRVRIRSLIESQRATA